MNRIEAEQRLEALRARLQTAPTPHDAAMVAARAVSLAVEVRLAHIEDAPLRQRIDDFIVLSGRLASWAADRWAAALAVRPRR